MLRVMIVIFFLALTAAAQLGQIRDQSEGEAIVRKARQAIGFDKIKEIFSYLYRQRKSIQIDSALNYENFEEISLTLPDKMRAVYSSESQITGSSKLTRIWSFGKYKAMYESESGSGRRTVKDITAEESKPVSKTVSDVIGKKTAAALQNSRKADQKSIFIESLWTSIFPITLLHPFEKGIEFKYVGKAKSNDKIANVVDVKPSNGKTYRLLFDSETNYLLMMIVSFKETNDRFVGDVEEKYYYSERKRFGDVLVPTKIKVEKRATPAGQSPVVKFSNIEILAFALNPKFDEKVFEIK